MSSSQRGQATGARPTIWPASTAALLGLLAVALVGVVLVGISVGTVDLPLGQVWSVIWTHLAGHTYRGSTDADLIIWTIRTPRVLLAAIAGASLAVAGTSLQCLVRNPLADPYILGVSAGASVGASAVVAFGSAAWFGLGVSGAAFAGALVSLGLVFLLAQRAGRLADTRLVLAGVAIAYVGNAVTSFLQLNITAAQLQGVMFWLMGTFSEATWADLEVPTAAILLCTVYLLLQARSMNALLTGDDAAAGLGVDVHRLRLSLLLVSSILTATVVAVAGGIGFVGLMVPHMTRFLVGGDHRRVLPVSALLGAVFLVVVDIATRTIDKPTEIPIGILTAALGAPFFLWLLRRRTAASF